MFGIFGKTSASLVEITHYYTPQAWKTDKRLELCIVKELKTAKLSRRSISIHKSEGALIIKWRTNSAWHVISETIKKLNNQYFVYGFNIPMKHKFMHNHNRYLKTKIFSYNFILRIFSNEGEPFFSNQTKEPTMRLLRYH